MKSLDMCHHNPEQADKVMTAHAEHLFANGNYIESADIFAETQRSFEEVALRYESQRKAYIITI